MFGRERSNKKGMNKRRSHSRVSVSNDLEKARKDKDFIAIKDEDKDGYIVLKQESLYKPLLIVFGIFLFVMIVLFPVSIFDNLWPDGMVFFRSIVKWGFFSSIATLLPLPVSAVDANLLLDGIFTGELVKLIYTIGAVVVFDTFWAFVGYRFTKTLRKLFASKTKASDEKKTNERFEKYGNVAMFVGAATPLPFTLMVYTAGALKLPKNGFVIAVFFGRLVKYSLFTVLLRVFDININDVGKELWTSMIAGELNVWHYIIFVIIGAGILWIVLSILKHKKQKKI